MSKEHNGAFMFKILEIVYTPVHERYTWSWTFTFYNYESRVTISMNLA